MPLLVYCRYPYYMLNVIDWEIGFVTWLRYTAWIPLYPTGFVLEGNIFVKKYRLVFMVKCYAVRCWYSTVCLWLRVGSVAL